MMQELTSMRDLFQSMVEQHDATIEELRSANEEVLSANEELQSTNEEMETAKEELQSVNEELTSVNEQLQHRNAELGRLNDDFGNLLGSAHVPMLVLGVDLSIRRFTPAAERLLHLVPGDLGRPIGNLKLTVDVPEMEELVAAVIDHVRVEEREVRDRDGRWHAVRIHPYRTADHRIDGAVVVIVDIHEVKRAGELLRESLEYSRAIIATMRSPFLVLDSQLRVQSANLAFYQAFRLDPGAAEGRLLYDLCDRQWDIPELRVLLEDVLLRESTIEGYEITSSFESIGPKVMVLNARRLMPSGDRAERILLVIEDATERQACRGGAEEHARQPGDAGTGADRGAAVGQCRARGADGGAEGLGPAPGDRGGGRTEAHRPRAS